MAYFTHENRQIFFVDNDAHAAKTGTPLIFLHGWSCDNSLFNPQMEYFAPQHRVIAIDHAGHGQSDLPTDQNLTIDRFAKDAIALLDHLEIKQAVLIGHSMGGVISLRIANLAPERVTAAILVDPAPLLSNETQEKFQAQVQAGLEDDTVGFIKRFAEKGLFIDSDDIPTRDDIVALMQRTPPITARKAWQALRDFDGHMALEKCSRPLCIISARYYLNNPIKLSEINTGIVHGQTVGAGHFNQIFAADQVNLMMARFMDGLEAEA